MTKQYGNLKDYWYPGVSIIPFPKKKYEDIKVDEENLLYKKIYGCLAAGYIYVSLGEPPRRIGSYSKKKYDPFSGFLGPREGAHYKAIEKHLGRVETLLPHTNQDKVFRWENGPKMHVKFKEFEAGMTEDGADRRFLTLKALMEKGGRITAEDYRDSWLKYANPENFGYLLTPRDGIIYEWMKRVPAREVGRYERDQGSVTIGQAVPPIGIINAGNPEQAALDTLDISLCHQSPCVSYGPYGAAAFAAGIAEAMKPNATVDSVIDTAIKCCREENVAEVIQEAIDLAKKYSDIYEIREPFYQKYGGRNATAATEVVPEAFAMFYISKGDPHIAGIGGANLGRDSDCVSSLGASLAGALSGIDSVKKDLLETVENAIKNDPHTIIDMSIKGQSDVMYQLVLSNMKELQNQVDCLETLMGTK